MDLLAHGEIVCEAYFDLVFEAVVWSCDLIRDLSDVLESSVGMQGKERAQSSIYTYLEYMINCRILFVCFRSERMDGSRLLTQSHFWQLADDVEAANYY